MTHPDGDKDDDTVLLAHADSIILDDGFVQDTWD